MITTAQFVIFLKKDYLFTECCQYFFKALDKWKISQIIIEMS